MALFLNRPVGELVVRARALLGMTQEQFGRALGVSHRTASRWDTGRAQPSVAHMLRLAALVHPHNAALAAEIAASGSETLESLGLTVAPSPPPLPPLPTYLLAEAVVCAAADALDTAPSMIRKALHAAFRRARELRLSAGEVEQALAVATGALPGRDPKAPKPDETAGPVAGPQ